jgi:hypothetical protein
LVGIVVGTVFDGVETGVLIMREPGVTGREVIVGTGVGVGIPVLTGWPVIIGLITRAITTMITTAATPYIRSVLSMTGT